MTEAEAQELNRDIRRALAFGIVHVFLLLVLLSALAQHAGNGLTELGYSGPRMRAALLGLPASFVLSLLATPIVLATPWSGRAWTVPLICLGLVIVWIAACGIVAWATAQGADV